jgi:hypothetical protein
VPVEAIGISMVVEGPTLSVVSVAHAEFNRLTVLIIGAVLAGHSITTGSIFRPIKRYAIDGDSNFPKNYYTLTLTISFRAISGIMTTYYIINR